MADSGPIPEAPDESWMRVDSALKQGNRGLPGGSSLTRLLAERRGIRKDLPPLHIAEILQWADAYHARHGTWPTSESGPIPEAPGVTWRWVREALQNGSRSLPEGTSLPRLLAEQRGVRNVGDLPPLT